MSNPDVIEPDLVAIPAGDELNHLVLALLRGYLECREPAETLLEFTARTDSETLVALTQSRLAN